MEQLKKIYKVLDGIFKKDERVTENEDWWLSAKNAAIDDIKNKLFELADDRQRFGFLCTVFQKTFENGKEYWYSKYYEYTKSKMEQSFFEYLNLKQPDITKSDADYISYCASVRQEMVLEISQACFFYEDIDFTKIMRLTGVSSNNKHVFWYVRNDEKEMKIAKSKQPGITQDIETINLLNIWIKGEMHYKNVISLLKKTYSITNSPFIQEDQNGKLTWQKTDNMWKYVAAFLHKSITKNCIKNIYTGEQWVLIIEESFNITGKAEYFRPGVIGHAGEEKLKDYLDPFSINGYFD